MSRALRGAFALSALTSIDSGPIFSAQSPMPAAEASVVKAALPGLRLLHESIVTALDGPEGSRSARRLLDVLKIRAATPADLVAWDPEGDFTVDGAALAHRHPTTPYAGKRLRGRVHHVWLRGKPVVWDGALTGPATGRLITGGRS